MLCFPTAILFEDAIILGAENDTMLMTTQGMASTTVPYSTLERTVGFFFHIFNLTISSFSHILNA